MAIQRNEEIKCGNHIAVTLDFNFTGPIIGLYKITHVKQKSVMGNGYIDFDVEGREHTFKLVKTDDFSAYKNICGG